MNGNIPRVLLATALGLVLAGCGGDRLGGHAPEPEEDMFFKAQTAFSEGKTDAAIEYLQQSIETKPTIYAYFQRAKLLEQAGRVDDAIRDCEAGLKLPVESQSDQDDLKWLLAECNKAEGNRFKGANAVPPSQRK